MVEGVYTKRVHYVHLKFSFRLAESERSVSMKNLVDEYSESPYVCLRSIHVFYESLGAHVDRAADINIPEAFSEST